MKKTVPQHHRSLAVASLLACLAGPAAAAPLPIPAMDAMPPVLRAAVVTADKIAIQGTINALSQQQAAAKARLAAQVADAAAVYAYVDMRIASAAVVAAVNSCREIPAPERVSTGSQCDAVTARAIALSEANLGPPQLAMLPRTVASAAYVDYRKVADSIAALQAPAADAQAVAALTAAAGAPYIDRPDQLAASTILGATDICRRFPVTRDTVPYCARVLGHATALLRSAWFARDAQQTSLAANSAELAGLVMPFDPQGGAAHFEAALAVAERTANAWPASSIAIAAASAKALAGTQNATFLPRQALVPAVLRIAAMPKTQGVDAARSAELCVAAVAVLAEPPTDATALPAADFIGSLRLAHRLVSSAPIAAGVPSARDQVRLTLNLIAASERMQRWYPGVQQEVKAILTGN